MTRVLRSLAGSVLRRLPARSDAFFAICRRYVERYRGENDSDLRSNGELLFLERVLPRCQVVFDVGAHFGDWAAAALAINPGLALHCFEPSAAAHERLLARGLPANVRCIRAGLSSAARTARLFSPRASSVLASLYQREGVSIGGIEPEDVCLETGDDYCSRNAVERVDYLKLDVEGHELEALRGLKRVIAEGRVGIVQFEYGGCNIDARVLLKDLFSFFDGQHARFFKLLPGGPLRVAGYQQAHENFQYQNWAVVLRASDWPDL